MAACGHNHAARATPGKPRPAGMPSSGVRGVVRNAIEAPGRLQNGLDSASPARRSDHCIVEFKTDPLPFRSIRSRFGRDMCYQLTLASISSSTPDSSAMTLRTSRSIEPAGRSRSLSRITFAPRPMRRVHPRSHARRDLGLDVEAIGKLKRTSLMAPTKAGCFARPAIAER
jgi:hypothetical protein